MRVGELVVVAAVVAAGTPVAAQVRTAAGAVEGTSTIDSGVRTFLGIPFAAPPVGELRWRAPQPPVPWTGVRKAVHFAPRCMQGRLFDDMIFRDDMGEDCLYLNVWTPARSATDRLPVMVWIYGGGFQAGSASEPRQDGERLAGKGVVVVSFNYRVGVFGFMAHPELTKESGRGASGNYGLLDQVAALQWVRHNIEGFGGDPDNVTIFGESAGSFSVSALMASPLARGLFQRAVGQSGAMFTVGDGTLAPKSLRESEQAGVEFATSLGAGSLAALRAAPAEAVLQAALKGQRRWFAPGIDGHVLPRDVRATYAEGAQAHVPLLAGWNADEVRAGVVLGKETPTVKSFTDDTRKRFEGEAEALLKLYPAGSEDEALESAAALAGDLFIAYATWKWIETHAETGQSPVYRYRFDRHIPIAPGTTINGRTATARDIGARHAGEIEYVFGTIDSVPKVTWEPADRKLSDQMMSYWTNFARGGDPNGTGLPAWPRYGRSDGHQVLHLDTQVKAAPDAHRARYEWLDAYTSRHSAAPATR